MGKEMGKGTKERRKCGKTQAGLRPSLPSAKKNKNFCFCFAFRLLFSNFAKIIRRYATDRD